MGADLNARERLMLADRLARGGLKGFGLKSVALYRHVMLMMKERAPGLTDTHADLWDKLAAAYRALGLSNEAEAAEQHRILEHEEREQGN